MLWRIDRRQGATACHCKVPNAPNENSGSDDDRQKAQILPESPMLDANRPSAGGDEVWNEHGNRARYQQGEEDASKRQHHNWRTRERTTGGFGVALGTAVALDCAPSICALYS